MQQVELAGEPVGERHAARRALGLGRAELAAHEAAPHPHAPRASSRRRASAARAARPGASRSSRPVEVHRALDAAEVVVGHGAQTAPRAPRGRGSGCRGRLGDARLVDERARVGTTQPSRPRELEDRVQRHVERGSTSAWTAGRSGCRAACDHAMNASMSRRPMRRGAARRRTARASCAMCDSYGLDRRALAALRLEALDQQSRRPRRRVAPPRAACGRAVALDQSRAARLGLRCASAPSRVAGSCFGPIWRLRSRRPGCATARTTRRASRIAPRPRTRPSSSGHRGPPRDRAPGVNRPH